MKNYYATLIIIAVSGLVIVFYYISKQKIRKYRTDRLHEGIWKKIYTDERTLTESRLRNVLGQLESQTIQWVTCYSRKYPQIRAQFIYSVTERQIQMDVAGEYPWETRKGEIKKMGVTGFRYTGELITFFLPVNARMATDMLSFCFYHMTGDGKLTNLSIKTSGV
jgi:hypothetical protein